MSVLGLSAATRVAGVVIALGFLVGLVPGPLAAALGGIGLITFGRLILSEARWTAVGVIGFGVVALAAIAGSLRWGTSSLDAIRGVQAVLGPTLAVEPQEAAIGAGLAAGGGTLGLALWLGASSSSGVWRFLWSCLEAIVVALLLATCFWGPAVAVSTDGGAGEVARDVGGWAAAVLAAAVPAVGLSLLSRRLRTVWAWVALAVAVAAVVAGAVLIPNSVIR